MAIDDEANERREDAQVRKLTAVQGVAVVILGAAHDLADNAARLSPTCQVVAVTTVGVERAATSAEQAGTRLTHDGTLLLE